MSMALQQQTGYAPSYGPSALPKQSDLVYYQQAYKQNELQQQQQNSHHHHLPSSQPPIPSSLPPPPSMSEQLQRGGYYTAGPPTPSTPTGQTGYYAQQGPLLSPDQMPPSTDPRAQPGGMFTRNLIGSLCVSAFKLTDPENRMGVWFVLQDLSVRTEGTFRSVSTPKPPYPRFPLSSILPFTPPLALRPRTAALTSFSQPQTKLRKRRPNPDLCPYHPLLLHLSLTGGCKPPLFHHRGVEQSFFQLHR